MENSKIHFSRVSNQINQLLNFTTMQTKKIYVTMTDKFMSGWGCAKGKTNKLIIICNSFEEAQTIERNAQKRSEMKYINICINRPRYSSNVLESWKTFEELGQVWKS